LKTIPFYLKNPTLKFTNLNLTLIKVFVSQILGPGLKSPPGGPAYLDRTVMSWHYYCWALGTSGLVNQPYNPRIRNLCDGILGNFLSLKNVY